MPILRPMEIKAGLQELPVAVLRSCTPCPLVLEQLIGFDHPGTRTEPVQLKVEFRFTSPSSSAAESVIGLNVEPGS